MDGKVQTQKALAAVNGHLAIGANSDGKVLSHNDSRASFMLTNDGASDAWVAYGTSAAVANQGFYLPKGTGQLYEDEWAGEVHVYSVGGTNICIIDKSYSTGDTEGEQVAGASSFTPAGPPGEATPTASLPVFGAGA